MVEGATVTLPLNEFDELREGNNAYRSIAPKIANCFEYDYKEFATPEACKKCDEENPDCSQCEVGKENPPFEETLTVDVDRLIAVCKQYALYGKNIYTDIDEMKIIKAGAAAKKTKPKPKNPKSTVNLLGGKSK